MHRTHSKRRDHSHRQSARDPAIIAIGNYWTAVEQWRTADRRLKRLKKSLPADLIRKPRVRMTYLLRGKDAKTGDDIKEPVYAYNEWEIKDRVHKDRDLMLSLHGGPSWTIDPKAKDGVRRVMTARAKNQRPVILAKYRAHLKDKIAEFESDRADLYARQRAAGWQQAVEAERAARSKVYSFCNKVPTATPLSIGGAIALMEFICATQRSRMTSSNTDAPYGLGDHHIAGISRRTADFLKRHRPAASRRH